MGSWGYTALDSDAAMEVQYIWDRYVAEHVEDGEWSGKDITRYFVETRWGEAVRQGDTITNGEILALVAVFRSKNIPIDRTLRKITEDAINRELVDAELERWEEPDERKEELLKLLNFVGGKVRKPNRRKVLGDPCLEYKNKTMAERELMKLTRYGKKLMFGYEVRNNEQFKKSLPQFIKTLDRFVHHGTWEKDSNIAIETVAQRLMMIAYYLGMSLGYSDERIQELITDAKWQKKSK